jgi:hypothetical protein
MNRRSLFKNALALFGIPSAFFPNAASGHAIGLPDLGPPTDPGITDSPMPPAWLENWLRLPMQPILSAGDLGVGVHPPIRDVATSILSCPKGGKPLRFRYRGGTDPGSPRSVLPVLLFRKIDPAAPVSDSDDGAKPLAPLYLLAHCLTRGEARTFRLDRIEMAEDRQTTRSTPRPAHASGRPAYE